VTSATVGLFIEKLPQLAQATREIFSRQRSATLNEIAATCIAGTTLIATTIACVATGYPEHLAVAAAGLVTEFTRWVQAARESR